MGKIWAKRALLASGWRECVAIEFDDHGIVSSIKADTAQTADSFGLLLPAPVNVHSHAFQRAMSGWTEYRGPDGTDSFWIWRQWMFRFLERLTPEQVEAITAYAQMEMLEAGYAASVEFHYLHHQVDGFPYSNVAEMSERVLSAAQRTGIGLTLLPVHYEFGGCDRRPLVQGQRRFGNRFDQYAAIVESASKAVRHLPADCSIGTASHSLRAVAPEDIARVRAIFPRGPFHMHLAEQQGEVDQVMEVYGMRPVEWILEHLDLRTNDCFIHCTQMLPHETEALARSGIIAGLCPITESNLGDGIFDGVRWFEQGGKISVGSDSNVRISLSEELRTLEYSQRLRDRSRSALASADQSTGRRLMDAILQGGALAANRNSGCIDIGKLADFCAMDDQVTDLLFRSGDSILDAFVFSGHDRWITDVWSAGRHVVRDGRHVDHDEITTGYRKAIGAIWSSPNSPVGNGP